MLGAYTSPQGSSHPLRKIPPPRRSNVSRELFKFDFELSLRKAQVVYQRGAYRKPRDPGFCCVSPHRPLLHCVFPSTQSLEQPRRSPGGGEPCSTAPLQGPAIPSVVATADVGGGERGGREEGWQVGDLNPASLTHTPGPRASRGLEKWKDSESENSPRGCALPGTFPLCPNHTGKCWSTLVSNTRL